VWHHCLQFTHSSWLLLIEDAAMDLKNILENFIKYKEQLDDLDRNGTESNSIETYEKQFMVCLGVCRVL